MHIPHPEKDFAMGFLTVTRREGEKIRLTIDPGVDTEKLLRDLLQDGITLHLGATERHGQIRIGIEAPRQIKIMREELIND